MANNLSVDDAMRAVYQEFAYPPISDDEFTERMYAERYGIPVQTAGRQLADAVKAGKLTWRWTIANGRRCKAYKMV